MSRIDFGNCITTNSAMGGIGGGPYSFLGSQPTDPNASATPVVDQFDFWVTDWGGLMIRGARLTWTDGTSCDLGTINDVPTVHSLRLSPGEVVTQCIIYSNTPDNRCGRIVMNTSADQTLDTGENGGARSTSLDVGSGLVIGVTGNDGDDVDSLAFQFLTDVESVLSTVTSYNNNNSLPISGINGNYSLYDNIWTNSSSQPVDWSFSQAFTRTESWEWSQSATTTYGLDVSVSADIFGIVKVDTSFNWQSSQTTSSKSTLTNTWQYQANTSGTIPAASSEGPGALRCQCICVTGTLTDIPFTASVTVQMKNGNSFSYTENGLFNSVSYYNGWIQVSNPPVGPAPTTISDSALGDGNTSVAAVKRHSKAQDEKLKSRSANGISLLGPSITNGAVQVK